MSTIRQDQERAYASCRDAIPCDTVRKVGVRGPMPPNVSADRSDVVCRAPGHTVAACAVSGYSEPVHACVTDGQTDEVYCVLRGRPRGTPHPTTF